MATAKKPAKPRRDEGAISYLVPKHDWDSGYAIWASAPDALDRSTGSALIHLGCLLEDFPDLAPSLRHAREHGEWIRDNVTPAGSATPTA